MSDWKQRLGVLYSTNPDYQYTLKTDEHPETLPADQQRLLVGISRKQRAGKEVSLITGFVGSPSDLEALAKTLKQKCGVGGSAKDGEILIQGDHRDRLIQILHSLGYNRTKRSN